jgi:CrcB protein
VEPPTPGPVTPPRASEGPAIGSEDRLPIDSDAAGPGDNDTDAGTLGDARVRRPVHLHPGYVLVVIAGGVFGALARYGLSAVIPAPGGWPLPTLIINLTGAFLLGVLLEALVRRGPDAGRRRVVRLVAGTGFIGAFTTYSTLALETNALFTGGRTADALIYVAATLIGGAIATVAGIRTAAGHHASITVRRRQTALRPEQQENER